MKKLLCLLLCVLLAVSLFSACSKQEKTVEEETTETTTEAVTQVDLDLSEMSGTVVYSEVYNIMSEPEKYIGKVIKIKGNFQIYQEVTLNKTYYACVIPDATACCQQGIEFVPKKRMIYPNDFPPLETEIVVSGKFTPYNENGTTYYTLLNSTMEVL